jgi:outer membrane protein OmpA-like peptidoglycan-associated protein/tetratricopeptide (TPR) repeat protein
MNKIVSLILASIVFLTVGCRSYSSYSLKLKDDKIPSKLKPVELKINANSYLDTTATRVYEYEMLHNICQLTAKDSMAFDRENMGSVEIQKFMQKKTRNPLWFVFCTATSIGTAGTASLLGIPVGHRKGVTKLQLDVKDKSGKIIKSYNSKGTYTAFITCYWGYKSNDAESKAYDMSFYKAMGEIRKQIENDVAELNEKLPKGLLEEDEVQAKVYVQLGDIFYEAKNYNLAISNYSTAFTTLKNFKKQDAQFIYKLGMSYVNDGKDSSEAKGIKYLKKAIEIDSLVDFMAPVGLYLAYKSLGEFDTAVEWLNFTLEKFSLKTGQKDLLNKWKKQMLSNKEQLKAGEALKLTPEKVEVNNIGAGINGVEADYFPSVTADESMLLFTSTRVGSIGGKNKEGAYDEDLWYSMKTEDGKWSRPLNFGTPVNTKNNNGIASFTGDGQFVVCGRCNEPDGYGSCDIYGATLTGNTWNTPINLGSVINSKSWDAQVSIAADGKALIWSSNREGGYGDQDLWMSKKNDKGFWTEAKNLGKVINTEGNEYSPFLHPDGKTLYFSSNNHSPRIGGIDIYKSTLNEDGSWSKPENLGYPINTEFDDLYYVQTPSGLKGYCASDRVGGFGQYDIYEIIYPQEKKSSLITFVGYVIDEVKGFPIEANIKVEDIDSSTLVGEYVSNSVTGKFVVILTPGRNYSMTVSKDNFLFYSENFNVSDTAVFQEIKKEVKMQKIEEGKKIVLNNIFFQTGKSELTESSALEIGKLYDLMIQNPKINVEISGHTDNVGGDVDNMKLSFDRAKVVVEALVTKGISTQRLIAKGYGKTQPIAPNDTPDNKQLNRRTEFKILGETKN